MYTTLKYPGTGRKGASLVELALYPRVNVKPLQVNSACIVETFSVSSAARWANFCCLIHKNFALYLDYFSFKCRLYLLMECQANYMVPFKLRGCRALRQNTTFQYLKGGYKEGGDSHFTRSHVEKTRSDGYKLLLERLRWDTRGRIFPVRTTSHWNSLPRGVVHSPALDTAAKADPDDP